MISCAYAQDYSDFTISAMIAEIRISKHPIASCAHPSNSSSHAVLDVRLAPKCCPVSSFRLIAVSGRDHAHVATAVELEVAIAGA